MADPTPAPQPTPPAEPPAPTTEEELQARFNAMFENAADAYLEKRKPAEPKTKQPTNFLDALFRT